MPFTNCQLTEEHLCCCICLDVFTDPVTLPCGHNFCRICITEHLSSNSQRLCPMCKEHVNKKHKLGVNRFISELVVQYRLSATHKSSGDLQQLFPPAEETGPPPRRGPKHFSTKWGLLLAGSMFLALFMVASLYFHHTLSRMETQPQFAAESTCTEHRQPLEFYCKNEQKTICRKCWASAHRFHQVVPVRDEYEEKKAKLGQTEAQLQRAIWQRQQKIQELRHSLKLSKEAGEQEMSGGVQMFSTLIQYLEKARAEFMRRLQEENKATETHVQSSIAEMELEISKLMRKLSKSQQLSRSEDLFHFLQSYQDLDSVLPPRDWTRVNVCPATFEGITRTVLVETMSELAEEVRNVMKKLQEAEMKNIPRFAVEVTLDPETAHPALVLSEDGKQVYSSDAWRLPPHSTKRFEAAMNVFGDHGFSCGRFYYDVQVKAKTDWTLGVAKESVDKSVETKLNPENGFWALSLQNKEGFVALDSKPISLPVRHHLERVRVFVDFEEQRVSFYDVDSAVVLYSFTGCSFNETIYPIFSPGPAYGGRNSAPLVIIPSSEIK